MTVPLVSIVIPCYDQGRFLGDAIEAALRQTHPRVEVIVVDDGSTDDTRRVAGRYVDDGVTCLAQQNAGTAVARNRGLRESRAEFVLFVDADDRLLPDAVSRGCAALAARPDVAFVSGHVTLIDPDGRPGVVPVQDHDPASYAALLAWNYVWTPGVVLYRRRAVEEAGGFDPRAAGSADFDLNIRIARRHAIACHHAIVLEYRQHGGNMTRDPALMLRSAVSVRRRERAAAMRHSARAAAAWRAGLRAVQDDFGGRLADRVKGDLIAGRLGRAVRGLACLLRFHPRGLAAMAAPREWPKLAARRWRTAAR